MKRKPLIIVSVVITLILSGGFAVYFFNKEINTKRLPLLGQIQSFELINHKGEDFTLKNLDGQVWIADFIFTSCSDICPIMTRNMGALNRTFEGVKGITLVSISVNPEFDSAEILADYAAKSDARDNWVFLTGKRSVIKKLAVESFKLGSIEEPIFHNSYFTLVDKNGLIRGYYDGMNQRSINKLFNDATILLKERSS